MEPKAYIVSGITGEYSDTHVWYVRVFLDMSLAEAFCKELNDWCKERGYESGGEYRYGFPEDKPPGDPDFYMSYTGVSYSICEVPLGLAAEYNIKNRECLCKKTVEGCCCFNECRCLMCFDGSKNV